MKKLFTLLSTLFLASAAFAQIPNAGFETWTSGGGGAYEDPNSWATANATIHSLLPGTYTCEKGTSGAPAGSAYLMLTSKTIATVVAPGIAVTGVLNVDIAGMTFDITGGFPNTTRPANLTGKWQHTSSGTDHPRVSAYLWKWNATLSQRDTVAIADTIAGAAITSWADFSIPFDYKSGSMPDSGIIAISTTDGGTITAGTSISADDLAFAGSVPAGVISVATPNASATIFPNPASGSATVYYHSNASREVAITLTDMTGKVVKASSMKASAGENSHTLSLHGLAQGMYFLQIADDNNVIQKKLIVQ